MIPCTVATDVEHFRSIIAKRFGLHFDDDKLGFLGELLHQRAEVNSCDSAAYVRLIEDVVRGPAERRALVQQLTVTETYFFRHIEQFRALVDVVVERARARPGVPSIRLLSAGCASGEEPYSLVMLVRERLGGTPCELRVRGVDVNAAMLDRARRGRYSSWSLRETPSDDVRRCFVGQGRDHVLNEVIRSAVTFEERNLAEPNPDLFLPESYDAVFCRNVLMYLTPETARRVVAQIARALVPGGYLFLGHAETLRGISSEFHLRHTHGTFYYERRDEAAQPPATVEYAPGWAPTASSSVPAFEPSQTWIETIERSSERIRALAQPEKTVPRPQSTRMQHVPSRGGIDLEPAIELLRKERFAEALGLVHALPAGSTGNADVLLLRSVLLIHGGQLDLAQRACTELLELDEHNPGAYYLLALVSEARGDREQARDHDQVAVYVDPSFAMARLHLGLLARQLGERATARRELEQALVLLEREDSSRLLLFGGGFERAALVALCRTQLLACGGAA